MTVMCTRVLPRRVMAMTSGLPTIGRRISGRSRSCAPGTTAPVESVERWRCLRFLRDSGGDEAGKEQHGVGEARTAVRHFHDPPPV